MPVSNNQLTLSILPDTLAICRLNNNVTLPDWAVSGEFSSITKTADELSIVCHQGSVPEDVRCERDWRCLKVEETLDFSLTGILAALAAPLAEAEISIFAVSTFDTDYLLVKENQLANAIQVLSAAGHLINR